MKGGARKAVPEKPLAMEIALDHAYGAETGFAETDLEAADSREQGDDARAGGVKNRHTLAR